MVTRAFKNNYSEIDWGVKMEAPKVEKQEIESRRASIPTPMILGDYEPYECPVTGKMIEGRKAHSENLKKTGCRILERGEKEHNTKNGKKRMFDQIDQAVDKCVEEVARDLL